VGRGGLGRDGCELGGDGGATVVRGGDARGWRRLSAARWRLGALVVCLIAGLLLGTARSYSQGEDIGNRSVDLSMVVQDAQRRVLTADATAARLQSQVDAAAQGDVSPQVESARAQVAALEPAAGLVAVTGPGISVSMSDAPRDADGNYPAGVDPDDLVVHQQDVQSVVNALWAGGAEAMMIMDQRVLTTSAVRCIGNTLLLQGRTYSPPFVVTAIGDAATMSAAVDDEPGVRLLLQYVDKYKLGFEVNTLESVDLPAYDGTIRMASAREGK
jgi:uncharacterized protein YlxW (UPF0749 family)